MGHLGRYQLIGRLAIGGMAEVYLALSGELTGFRTLVVVKRILPHLASNEQFIGMFLDEARLAALLDHPNIVRIIEVGHDGDEYFLVMEVVQGKPLSSVLRKAAKEKSPLTPALAAFVVAQAANGLGYAHNLADSQGNPLNVVHRDVSPQNILVSFEGAVKVIDFGIARALGRVSETSPGGLKGKIEYMAPEQTSAEEVDHRVDIFALGVVLWEALTGRRLFRRDTELAVMRAIVEDEIPRPSELVPITPQLESIVMQALHKRREERFQTAQEMALALERYAFASEGFSPLQLATYMKGLFDTEFAQWKKTVSSALEMDVVPVRASGTLFPVLRPDLPTRGPTVSLRVGQGALDFGPDKSPGPESAVAPTALVSSAPSKRDRLWVYGGLGAVAAILAAGWLVLSRPPARDPGRSAAQPPAGLLPATPPAPAGSRAPSLPSAADQPASGATEADPGVAAPADPGAAAESGATAPKSRSRAQRGGKGRAHARSGEGGELPAQEPDLPTDHRPNPF
jgi:eukaryotic-like serine/threonine-protein kinase